MAPLLAPEQEGETMVERDSAAGWVTVALTVAVQALASVTVTVYVPAPTFNRVAGSLSGFSGPSLLQSYVKPGVPPLTLMETEPLEPPLHKTFVTLTTLTESAEGWETVAEVVAVQPLA